MICSSCEQAIWKSEHANVVICRHCWNTLPKVTRQAFENGANAKRITDMARIRRTTATQLRAGQHTRK